MAQINPRTFADAKQLGDNIYELILTNWGNRGLLQDPNNGSISYPPIKTLPGGIVPILGTFELPEIPSLAAIAISPRSTVDRCVLNFASLPQLPKSATPGSNEDGFVPQGNMLETEQLLSIHSPLIGQLPGPIVIRAHETSYFSDSYIEIGSNLVTTKPFGTALPPATGGALIWTNPELRLLLYLTGRAALPPPVRAPFHFATATYTFTTVAPATELLAVVPVAGRRYARVNFKGGGGDYVLNVTGVQWNGQPTGGPTFVINRNFEYPLLPATIAFSGPNSVSVVVENPGLTFLLLKVSTNLALDTVRFTIDTYD